MEKEKRKPPSAQGPEVKEGAGGGCLNTATCSPLGVSIIPSITGKCLQRERCHGIKINLAVWTLASYLAFVFLSFFTCEMGISNSTMLTGLLGGISEMK